MYTVNSIANYFIEKGVKHQNPVNPMKLQKLIYFAHGVSLAVFKKPLINEEFETWEFGPVLKKLYDETKRYGNTPMSKPLLDYDGENLFIPIVDEEDEFTIRILNGIWDVFGDRDVLELADMTHKKGSPWDQVYEEGSENTYIDDKIIKTYFEKSFVN